MKFTVAVLITAVAILFIVLLELVLGIRWSMQAWTLPDADFKPIRPAARFAFTGIIITGTLHFGSAWIYFVDSRDR
ncbi:hypothetical protein BH09VER1_BH09VER1_33110 [soil metagenome]